MAPSLPSISVRFASVMSLALSSQLVSVSASAAPGAPPICKDVVKVLENIRSVCGDGICDIKDIAKRVERNDLLRVENAGDELLSKRVFFGFATSGWDERSVTNFSDAQSHLRKVATSVKGTKSVVLVLARASTDGGNEDDNVRRSRERALSLREALISYGAPAGQVQLAYVGALPRLRLHMSDAQGVPPALLARGHRDMEEALNQSAVVLVDRCKTPPVQSCTTSVRPAADGVAHRVVLSGGAVDDLLEGWFDTVEKNGHTLTDTELSALEVVYYSSGTTPERHVVKGPALSPWTAVAQMKSNRGVWMGLVAGKIAGALPAELHDEDADADVFCGTHEARVAENASTTPLLLLVSAVTAMTGALFAYFRRKS